MNVTVPIYIEELLPEGSPLAVYKIRPLFFLEPEERDENLNRAVTDERIYPCDETISLRVACVHGRQEGGLLVSALPLFGIRFYYYDSQNLKYLVVAYVQENLKGRTPRELSRFLPPKQATLDEIVLNVSKKEKKRKYTPPITNLNQVADPPGDPSVRKQFSRAWERETEVADLVARLTRENANVILVGESGSGKSARALIRLTAQL